MANAAFSYVDNEVLEKEREKVAMEAAFVIDTIYQNQKDKLSEEAQKLYYGVCKKFCVNDTFPR